MSPTPKPAARTPDVLATTTREVEGAGLDAAPWGHRLHDYVRESVLILDRLVGYAREDAAAADTVSLEQNLADGFALAAVLDEELGVLRANDAGGFTEVDVTTRGLRGDSEFDNQPPFRALLEDLPEGPVRLIFPAGEYYFGTNGRRSTLELMGRADLHLAGRGKVTLLLDGGPKSGHNLWMGNCRNIAFENLTIDNRPTPFTLGEIERINGPTEIEVEIGEQHPLPDPSYETARFFRGIVRDPITGEPLEDRADPRISRIAHLDGRRYAVHLDDNSLSGKGDLTRGVQPGELFSIHPRERPGGGDGARIENCRHLFFDRVDVRSGDEMLFRVSGCVGVKFIDCDFSPLDGRRVLNNADAFHCRSNEKGPYLDRCRVLKVSDDCLTLYTKLVNVGEVVDDRTFVTLSTTKNNVSQANLAAGVEVGFMNANTGIIEGQARIESVEAIDWGGKEGVLKLRMDRDVPGIIGRRNVGRPDHFERYRDYNVSGGDAWRRAMRVDAPFEHMLVNLGAKNDGFIVRNCEMGRNRANGIRCKAANGTVRDTVLHRQKLYFLNEPSWREGVYARNITIENVRADAGVRYSISLPDAYWYGADAAEHMKRFVYENAVDAEGRPIPTPAEVVATGVTDGVDKRKQLLEEDAAG